MSPSTIISSFVKSIKLLQEFIYPYKCLECEIQLDEFSGLCGVCAQKFELIQDDHCRYCGLPFELSVGNQMSCASCLQEKPIYDYARSVFIYEQHIKKHILRLKYADMSHMVPFFARQMFHYIQSHSISADYIIPVPSHYHRVFMRKYNPVALIADELGKLSQIAVLMQGLKRVQQKSQKGFNKSQRARYLVHNFECPKAMQLAVYNKNILLIDDVMTTGATVKECSKSLLKSGAKSVVVLTISRAVLLNNHDEIDF